MTYIQAKIKLTLFAVLIAWGFTGTAQTVSDFEKDFKITLDSPITNPMASRLIMDHYNLLLWFYTSDTNARAYPLIEIRNEEIYQNNIAGLFANQGQSVNTLACLLAASTFDTSKISDVKKVLINSSYKDILAAKCLLVLGDKDLGPIVKCIIANNFSESVQYLTIDFLNVEQSLLEKFALDSLFSSNQEIQYLAVKAMAEIPPKPTNEVLLRQAVVKFDTVMKGWAIAALAKYNANNILPLIKDYLSNDQLQQVSWRALAASTSVEDMDYISQIASTKSEDPYFLDALLNSYNDVHLRNWLGIVKRGDLPKDYFINISGNTKLKEDKYFKDISEIISNSKNEMQAYALMRYFDDRKDQASLHFLNTCLTHSFEGIREQAEILLKK
ncbi:MAG: hypothetical protein EOO90_13490 [Pedobacter sp.]|nr:MAG: hypothetical protein EOO90_13490 [Pedobacter sp.]